jgi:hypothetical protein
MDTNREITSIKRFNSQNFHIWSFQMCALFLGKDIMGVVDETRPKPTAANAQERDEWIKKDGHRIYYLSTALDESILDLICGCASLNAIWEKLKTRYDQRVKFY